MEIPLYLLVQWARNQGQVPGTDSLTVSGLAPGNYRHCFVSAKEAAEELGKRRYWRQPGSGACQELFLGPGGNGTIVGAG